MIDASSDDELEEVKRLIDNKDAAKTKRTTKLAYNVFSSVVDVAAAEKDLASVDCGQTCGEIFRNSISFIDPPLWGFGEIFPSVMIFPSG